MIQVLKSVICSGSWPEMRQPDVEQLLALAHAHRVAGRVLERLANDPPSWNSEGLLAELGARQHENERYLAQQVAVLGRIRALVPSGGPLMIIKGISAYVLTGDTAALRRMADLDILSENGGILRQKLTDSGFTKYRNVSPHELINVVIDGVEVDLHDYVPVWGYEADVRVGSIAGHQCVYHSGEVTTFRLTYADFLAGGRDCRLLTNGGVWVTSPEMSALISCVSAFRDYLSLGSVTGRGKPPVRLAELAEVRDLTGLADFSPVTFLAHVKRHHAWHAVWWMATLIYEIAGDSSLLSMIPSEIKCDAYTSSFPRMIWGGFWYDHQQSADELLTGHPSTYRLLEDLGFTDVSIAHERSDWYATSPVGDDRPFRKIHRKMSGSENFECRLAVAVTAGGITIWLDVVAPTIGNSDRVFIDLSGRALEWERKPGGVQTVKTTRNLDGVTVVAEPTSSGYKLRAHVSQSGSGSSEIRELPAIIGIGRFEVTPKMPAGILLPLIVRF